MFHIALFEPKIPQNTGNIIRLVANTGFSLHLIGPLAFEFTDRNLLRAGLDYHDMANVMEYENYSSFRLGHPEKNIWGMTTKGSKYYHQVHYTPGDILLFGAETSGLSEEVRQDLGKDNLLRIPMQPNNRSMNLANTVALTSYEAWRQNGFAGGL